MVHKTTIGVMDVPPNAKLFKAAFDDAFHLHDHTKYPSPLGPQNEKDEYHSMIPTLLSSPKWGGLRWLFTDTHTHTHTHTLLLG